MLTWMSHVEGLCKKKFKNFKKKPETNINLPKVRKELINKSTIQFKDTIAVNVFI